MLVLVDLILSMFIKFPCRSQWLSVHRRDPIWISRILKVKIKFHECNFKSCLNMALLFCSSLENFCTLFMSYLPVFNQFKKEMVLKCLKK